MFAPKISKMKSASAQRSPVASRPSGTIRNGSDAQEHEDASTRLIAPAPSWDLSKVSMSPSPSLEPFRRRQILGAARDSATTQSGRYGRSP